MYYVHASIFTAFLSKAVLEYVRIPPLIIGYNLFATRYEHLIILLLLALGNTKG